ncbi:MAG: type II toxin-antitoxin system PemK/MazF family toxin [Candidatus Saccharimonas sp.]|nr:type II toxin-antitoxin system PemK/MazF family toxin [Planctomycetaceae bacterium]
MTYRRGDVVLAWYPFASGTGGSLRPALVVQNDADNTRMGNTIVAQITTNLMRAGEPTHLLIETATPEGRQSGLLHDSVVSGNNLATIEETLILRKIGRLSATMMAKVDGSLKAALALP